ncbi:MAG: replication-relaxation family protein [Romboutsia sp.]
MAKKNKVIFDSLVTRDKKIIELIEKVGVVNRDQIQRVLFKNVHQNVPMRRLTYLAENKLIKRSYYQIGEHKNVYIYYLEKKPSKRNIKHEITVSEFIIRVMEITEVLEVSTHYTIGNIITDGYIRYKDNNSKIRHLFLEIQLSNKVSDCVEKYEDIKNIILENRKGWEVIPRLIVITDLEHHSEQVKNMKVKYDTTEMKNLREILF